MNIFVLDKDLTKCAQYYCDKHIVKMILETAQLLCSTYYFTDEIDKSPYKLTHKNHPCSLWVRASLSNWIWTRDLGLALYVEYKYRYENRTHKSGEVIRLLKEPNLPNLGITKRPQVMPEQYFNKSTIQAYRNYYNGEKQNLLKYTKRDNPYWIKYKSI